MRVPLVRLSTRPIAGIFDGQPVISEGQGPRGQNSGKGEVIVGGQLVGQNVLAVQEQCRFTLPGVPATALAFTYLPIGGTAPLVVLRDTWRPNGKKSHRHGQIVRLRPAV